MRHFSSVMLGISQVLYKLLWHLHPYKSDQYNEAHGLFKVGWLSARVLNTCLSSTSSCKQFHMLAVHMDIARTEESCRSA